MVNRIPWKLKRGIYEAVEWGEVQVSTNDTITVDSIDDAASSIYRHVLWKMSDGAVVESSAATNVITVTDVAASNTKCIYMVYGVKA
jgi:hypothetical protein